MAEHQSVLLDETIEWLAIRPHGIYVDCTTGPGGHSRAIAERLESPGRLICRDCDRESLELAQANLADLAGRIVFDAGKFSGLRAALDRLGIGKVDGLLADLGWSMWQLRGAERGFSFNEDAPLDMRYDRSSGETAADLLNFSSEHDIAKILQDFGEERKARRIARAILKARPVSTSKRLADIVEQAKPRDSRIHPATLTFQALRIAVNDELGELEALLAAIPGVVAEGGRAAIISFHSVEDRMVKRAFQQLARGGRAELLTRHVVTPRPEEVLRNPASRSAKLRALQVCDVTTAKGGNRGK